MGIDNIEDVIKYATTIQNELNNCYKELEILNNVLFTKWQEKDNLRRRIRDLEYEKSRIHKYIDTYSDFDKDKFMIFIREFLNLNNGNFIYTKIKSYTYHYNRNPEKRNTLFEYYSRENRTITSEYNTHYFITDPNIAEFITNNSSNEMELKKYSNFGLLNHSIHLSDDNFSIFNDDFSINEEFLKFPELVGYLFALIQSKIDYPDISDYERYNAVLESVSAKQKNINNP